MQEYVPHPNGYPLVLFAQDKGEEWDFILAADEHSARQQASNGKVYVLTVKDLISTRGHSGACKLLKTFDNRWVCKSGRIFFRGRELLHAIESDEPKRIKVQRSEYD
jgi:hypothetical protein